jgi:Spy/CpxP family protein refolding chaperone
MRGTIAILLATGLICISGTNLFAYGPPEGREKQRERMEILRMWKMMEALDLDRDTANKMIQIRQEFVKKRKDLRKEIRQEFKVLREIVKSPEQPGEEAKLKALLDGIRRKRHKMKELWHEQYDGVSKILTVRQQAQLMVFLKDFHREVRDALRGFRHGPPHGRGKMRHRGPNPPFMDREGRQPGPPPGPPKRPPSEAVTGAVQSEN